MKLTFLGTAAGGLRLNAAGGVCNASAIALEFGEHTVLLDCGPGATAGLIAAGIPVESVNAILVSHLHMDHVQGLPELLAHMVSARAPMPLVQGPSGTADYVRAAAEATRRVSYAGGKFGGPLKVPCEDIASGDERELFGLSVRTVEVPHTPVLTAVARRIELEGRTLVYSGDTTASASIMERLSEGADVLVHEAYSLPGIGRWTEGMPGSYGLALARGYRATHSDVSQVARVAAEARVKAVIFTHLNEGERDDELMALARPHFAGEILVAYDGMEFPVR